MDNIEKFVRKINQLIQDNDNLKRNELMLRQQLVVTRINAYQEKFDITDMDYPNLNQFDWNKISIGVAIDQFSVLVKTDSFNHRRVAKSWDDLPKVRKEVSHA